MPEDKPSFPMSYLSTLRFPQLFVLLGVLFFADLVVPDLIPFFDELLLGLLTVMVGTLRSHGRDGRKDLEKPPEKNVTPRSG